METRISFLVCLVVACAGMHATATFAQSGTAGYPAKPIRIIVPLAAGGPSDIMARTLANNLSEIVRQTVIVDNRPGASGTMGTEIAAKSPPDGYTLLLAQNAFAINPSLFRKLPYDVLKDFTAVSLLASTPYLLNVHSSLPVRSVKQLIALAKARPGELNHASGGSGTGPHLAMEVFMQKTGIKMVHITYKGGGPAMNDFIAGHTQVYLANMVTALPHVRSGRIRALAVSTLTRSRVAPDIPTIDETGVRGFDESGQHGIVAPAGVPKEIITKLQRDIATAMRSPEVVQRLAAEGSEAVGSTAEEFATIIRREMEKWAKVIRAAGIQPQ